MDIGKVYLSEIFSAIQGEGPLVGVRQIFVRFSVCDLRCVWCDTPESLIRNKFCNVETKAGSRQFNKILNPISIVDIVSFIETLNPKVHHSVSFTGGEPLLQSEIFPELVNLIKDKFSLKIYLETGGHRPDKLINIIDCLDFISMDFKLPSSANAGEFWEKHQEFLKLAVMKRKKIWVKAVVTKDTVLEDLSYAAQILNSVDKEIEIFLQPVTQIENCLPPDEKQLLEMQEFVLNQYKNVRVLPQVHRLIGQK